MWCVRGNQIVCPGRKEEDENGRGDEGIREEVREGGEIKEIEEKEEQFDEEVREEEKVDEEGGETKEIEGREESMSNCGFSLEIFSLEKVSFVPPKYGLYTGPNVLCSYSNNFCSKGVWKLESSKTRANVLPYLSSANNWT